MHWRICALQPAPPPCWIKLTSRQGLSSAVQKRDWQLVLNARGIPFCLCRAGKTEHIFTPALLHALARSELAAYAKENTQQRSGQTEWPLHKKWQLAPVFLLPIIWWHGCQLGWWPTPDFLPNAQSWQASGKLDNVKILIYDQWWRLATALTLHSNVPHLGNNIFFGTIFIAVLARLCGTGRAWLLTIGGGILGNLASIFIHKPGYASIGFSTALFASIGAIAGIRICQHSKKIFLPLGASIGLLAMLGAEGANTDYAAHICGLCGGFLLGFAAGASQRLNWPQIPQFIAGLAAFLLPVFAWSMAFGWHF